MKAYTATRTLHKNYVTIRNQPSYAGKKISRVIREIFCNNKEASA